jgi:crossover junction endodeoxyribonuclease RuvC
MKKARRILGFDPGYGRLGFGVIDVGGSSTPPSQGGAGGGHGIKIVTFGVITTKAGTPSLDRLKEIAADVRNLIAVHQPDAIGIEELFFGKNVTTAIKVAEVRGVLLLLAAENGLPVTELKPVEVKMALTGYGKADKRQMQQMVKTVFGLQTVPKPDDAADALAIAWAASTRVF